MSQPSAGIGEFVSKGRVYPIVFNNKTSKTFLRMLKKGDTDVVRGKAYVWNRSTGRLVNKSTFYTAKGEMRAKFSKNGWEAEKDNPNVVFKPLPKDFKSMFDKHENNFSNPKYYVNAKPYDLKKKSEQQRINEDPEKVSAKISDLKRKGYVEIDGTTQQIVQQLRQYIGGTKKNGKQSLTSKLYIAYVTKEGLYRKGGFVRHINLEKEYIAIGTDVGISFSCNLKNVKAVYLINISPKKDAPPQPAPSAAEDEYGSSYA